MRYTIPCKQCKGKGILTHFKHVENGICFKCYGSKVEEVSKQDYADYIKTLEREKEGSYALFKKGEIEYYKTESEIESKYGNFHTSTYGIYSANVSYKDENIVYVKHSTNTDNFINEVNKEYKLRIKKKVIKDIEFLNGLLDNETDPEWKTIYTNKIEVLKQSIC